MKKLLSAAVAACLLLQTPAVLAETVPAEPPAEVTSEAREASEENVPEDKPEQEPSDDSKQDPAEDPTDDPTENPTDAPSENPTEGPADDPSEDPTDAPAENPGGDPTENPTDEPTQEPQVPEDAEAWMRLEDGQLVWGKLADVIAQAPEGATLWLRSEKPMFVEKAPILQMSKLRILPDEEIFKKGDWRVAYSAESPEAVENPEELDSETFKDADADAVAPLYVWVAEKIDAPQPTPTPDPGEVQISVEAKDYTAASWGVVPPVFTLSGIPEGMPWSYAAVIYDERFEAVEGNTYAAEEEGVYTLRFVILDEYNDILSASESYTILQDHTAPEVSAMVDEAQSFTLSVSAKDAVSGVKAVSVDGGKNWNAMEDGGAFVYTAPEAQVLEPGQVQVRDTAGNVWISAERYSLAAIDNGGGIGGGGGGGGDGSGSGKKPQPHAKSEGKEGEYDAMEMKLPEEPMHTLTIDGTELPLTLELASAEGFEIPEGYQPQFTAEMAAWTAAPKAEDAQDDSQEEGAAPDTLILTAVEEENLGDRFEYRWKFNGEVYRMLANSSVKYLALNVGGDMAVFPTEGFTGGTKYTALKMEGVSTKKFDYTVSMVCNLDPDRIPMLSQGDYSEDCDLAIQVEVEGEKYTLSAEQKGEMYYFGVCLGPREMMSVPYGEYAPASHD